MTSSLNIYTQNYVPIFNTNISSLENATEILSFFRKSFINHLNRHKYLYCTILSNEIEIFQKTIFHFNKFFNREVNCNIYTKNVINYMIE